MCTLNERFAWTLLRTWRLDRPTQYEIAIEAGTHRETVSREMAQLARDGVIACDRTRLDIHQPENLREGLM